MNRRAKSRTLATAVIAISLTIACGGSTLLKSFRIALASSNPLVNALADSGAISRTKATAIIRDFDAGALCGVELQRGFEVANTLPENQRRAAKFTAASTALKCFRVIIDRQNFAAHPRIQQAAAIAEGILASLVIFYSDSSAERASAPAGRATHIVIANDEKELEEGLKRKVKELEAVMKVR